MALYKLVFLTLTTMRSQRWGPEYAGPLPAITNERTECLDQLFNLKYNVQLKNWPVSAKDGLSGLCYMFHDYSKKKGESLQRNKQLALQAQFFFLLYFSLIFRFIHMTNRTDHPSVVKCMCTISYHSASKSA